MSDLFLLEVQMQTFLYRKQLKTPSQAGLDTWAHVEQVKMEKEAVSLCFTFSRYSSEEKLKNFFLPLLHC